MNLIMDYGAPCLISDHLKNKITEPLKELKTKGDLPNGESKELTLYYFISKKFKIDDIAFSELGFIVSDMSDIITALNTNVDGLLGINALNELITEINFETQTVNMYTDTILLNTEGFHKIPYTYQSKVQKTPMIPCIINGVKVQLILDTGYGGMLTVSSTDIYNSMPDSLIKKETVTGITAGAKFQIDKKTTTINAIDFDNFKIAEDLEINIDSYEDNTGVIGIKFLREFFSGVIINPFNKEIYFKLK